MQSAFIDSLRSWVEWASAWLKQRGDVIPSVTDFIPDTPWRDEVYQWAQAIAGEDGATEREATFEAFGLLQSGPGYKLAERFVAIAIGHALGSEIRRVRADAGLGEVLRQMDYPRLEDAANELRQDLSDLVHLMRPEDCPSSWAIIRWEISNAYLIGRLERAFELLELIPRLKLMPAPDLLKLRGHIRFLSVFQQLTDNDRDDYWDHAASMWPPAMASPAQSALLFGIGACGEQAVNLTPEMRSAVRDVIADLEKAMDQGATLGVEYRMALARCYFETERYTESVRHYESVLLVADELKEFLAVLVDERRKRRAVARSLVAAYRLAGDSERARLTLLSNMDAFEDRSQGLREVAKLQAASGDFMGAYESLRKVDETDPKGTDDWLVSTVLALGGIATAKDEVRKQVDGLFERDHQTVRGLEDVVAAYWRRYTTLSPEAKKRWLRAVYYRHWPFAPEPIRAGVFQDALAHYATAVELELEARVFREFRQSQSGAAWPPKRAFDKDADPLESYVARGRPLTLGQMARALGVQGGKAELGRKLQNWVQRHHPTLLNRALLLERVTPARNEAVHTEAAADSLKVEGYCRTVLESIEVMPARPPVSS